MNFPFNKKGFLGAIGSFLGNVLNKGAESAASVVGGAVGSKLGDKINGVPSALSASEQGQQAKEYMDAAYGGTTNWDRLGAGGGGAPSSTSGQNIEQMKIKNENKMQTRELVTRSQIADRQNLTHLISSAASLGIPAVNELVNTYRGAKATDYDNPNVQARELLPAKKHAEISSGNLAQSQVAGHDARSKRANEIIDSDIHSKYYGSASSAAATTAKSFGGNLADAHKNAFEGMKKGLTPIQKLLQLYKGDNKRPARFNIAPLKYKNNDQDVFKRKLR